MNHGALQAPATIRAPTPADVPFITSAWMHGAIKLGPYDGVPNPVRSHHLHRQIERLWADQRTVWLLAAWPKDVNFIYGFLAGQATDRGPVLHWLYVRRDMRRLGVATALMADFLAGQEPARLFVTSDSAHWRGFERASSATRGHVAVYDPWLLWDPTWNAADAAGMGGST